MSFRHVFYNEKTPEQFRKGVKITPIKIRQKPGETARKQKLRRISDSKLAHLKKFVDDLTAQGVIEELDDATDCYASPIHIVLEERFVASKNAVVAKARCTADLRELNRTLPESSFPLPLCEEFRQEVARKGFKVFSNFDAASCFFQFPVDKETSRRLFGIHALNRIFSFLRLIMGCSLSPPVVQKCVTQFFRYHE